MELLSFLEIEADDVIEHMNFFSLFRVNSSFLPHFAIILCLFFFKFSYIWGVSKADSVMQKKKIVSVILPRFWRFFIIISFWGIVELFCDFFSCNKGLLFVCLEEMK